MKVKRADARTARHLLERLLRTPKSRAGLVAAVKVHGIGRNFVFGYLTSELRVGRILVLKSGVSIMYQRAECVVHEAPAPRDFPTWLEPRSLPLARGRRIFIDGREVDPDAPTKQEEQEES